MEIWKEIVGYGKLYEVSSLGKVRRHSKSIAHDGTYPLRILKGTFYRGYLKVKLGKLNHKKLYFVHRLVAENFIGKSNNNLQINHINGIKADNRLENLEWCTPKQNTQHAIKNGMRHPVRGEENGASKLTKNKIKKIRKIYSQKKFSCAKLAKEFGVCPMTINLIIRKIIWAHVD